MKTPPNVIWLQWYDEDGFEGSDDDNDMTPHLVEAREVTWCEDQVNDYDVKYVRKDISDELYFSLMDLSDMFGDEEPGSRTWHFLHKARTLIDSYDIEGTQ